MIKTPFNRWLLLPSGRLLFMLSAASLCLGSAGQTQSGRKVNLRAPQARLAALAPAGVVSVDPVQVARLDRAFVELMLAPAVRTAAVRLVLLAHGSPPSG